MKQLQLFDAGTLPILLDIDLDAFNECKNPQQALQDTLVGIKPGTPAIFVVEHHHILSRVKRWIKDGKLPTPFDWIHIDAHHDLYGPSDGRPCDCSNYCYRMPLKHYRSFTWVSNGDGENHGWCDEEGGALWLQSHKKLVDHNVCLENWWNQRTIAGVCLVLSPDFTTGAYIPKFTKTIHENPAAIMSNLDLECVPQRRPGTEFEIYRPSGWRNVRIHHHTSRPVIPAGEAQNVLTACAC